MIKKTQHREFPHAVPICSHRKNQKSTIKQKDFNFFLQKAFKKQHF